MGLEMKRGSQWWYGRYRQNDKIVQVRLDVKIAGRRPAKITDAGDRAFENSRGEAARELQRVMEDLRGDPLAERSLQRLVELKTGRKASFPKLAELPALWSALPRRRAPTPRYLRQGIATLKEFVAFVAARQPQAAEFVAVSPATAQAFFKGLQDLAPKSYNDKLKLLRTTFRQLHPQLNEGSNPFHGLVTRSANRISREPYSVEELQFILEASRQDPIVHPVIVAGMCTAMRRGDCCLLKWSDVDLDEGFITVKTAKTGATVDIPIFPPLRLVLQAARKTSAADDACCFPDAARMYQSNPDGITWRVKQIVAEALAAKARAEGKLPPVAAPEEVRTKANQYLAALPPGGRTAKMREVLNRYLEGRSGPTIAAEMNVSKGLVSAYLNEIEDQTGLAFIRGKVRQAKSDVLQAPRSDGRRRASVRDFHSFRVTWVTLALASGLPMELVQRVTGHRTVEVVLKHYFRPGREEFRQAVSKAMPQFLTASSGDESGGQTPAQPLLAAPIESSRQAADIARLLERVKGAANRELVAKAMAMLGRGQSTHSASATDSEPKDRL